MGTSDGHWLADLGAAALETALQGLAASLITPETVQPALARLPIDDAAREVIAGCVECRTDADELVAGLDVSRQARRRWRSFVKYAL